MSQQQKSTKEASDNAAIGSEGRKLPFAADELKALVDLMVTHDLTRVELREGDKHILLRRGQAVITTTPAAYVAPVAAAAPAPAPVAPPPAAAPTDNEILIRSPMVGTFYAAAEPEAPPFVAVGTQVNPNTVVCLLEAMKVFNEIKAECAGRITKVLVKNAQAVEYDQPLFAVAPA
jgi:acetyl-CoA carboxylase biotin carboxyl carrier protein